MKTVFHNILALLVGAIIFVGIPLLGWGITDISNFFTNSARLIYVILILLLMLFSMFYNPHAGKNKQASKSGLKKPKIDLVFIQILSLAIVFFAPFSDKHSIIALQIADIIRFAGFVLLIPGFILMAAAEKYLAEQFSVDITIQENHKLIQNGPYKFIRHPRYLGILAFFIGISLVYRSLLAVFLVAGLGIILIWRIYAEEVLLQQEFGEEWEGYCRKSWRLIPYLF